VDRANVLGVGVHAVNLPLAASIVDRAVSDGRKGYVCVTGVHGVMEAQHDSFFKQTLDRAMLVVPDGVPTVWMGHWEGFHEMGRVFGPDLMKEVCRQSVTTGRTHFLYGGRPGVVDQLKHILESWYPGIRVVGTYTPPFRPLSLDEKSDLQAMFSELSPDIVWVGLSTPKQERFMAEYIHLLDCRIMIGVGAAFDIHTGLIKDAPQWMKSAGLQWFHRLCQEPSRLWKRYMVNNSAFLIQVAMQFMGIKRFELAPGELHGD
jgi:N-acetylglucosaminyldiphosphoundecaprenol N-acetyl-beta-D-mannosaminyltransferase